MNNNTKTILTLVTGAVAGAVTALLLAPQAGTETRRALKNTTSRLRDDLSSTLQNGLERINSLRGNDNEDLTDEMGNDSYGSSYGRSQSSGRGAGNPTGLGNTGTSGSGLGSTGSTGSATSSRTSQGSVGNV